MKLASILASALVACGGQQYGTLDKRGVFDPQSIAVCESACDTATIVFVTGFGAEVLCNCSCDKAQFAIGFYVSDVRDKPEEVRALWSWFEAGNCQ